jgi:hypothetical protein
LSGRPFFCLLSLDGGPVAEILEAVKAGWQIYTLLLVLLTSGVAFAGIPGRVDALETRMDRSEVVNRYTACVLKNQSDGYDPRACESHLTPDVIEYLKPRGAP